MFLSAVLQAHTNSVSQAQSITHPARAAASPRPKQNTTVALPERLEKDLTRATQERRQPLPVAHRWL
jgi:hypothetical protein